MMRAGWVALVLAGLAGCTAPQSGTVLEIQPTLPEGYPPQIGAVSASLGGAAQAWDTYDYSIGAFDASVQVLGFNGEI